VLLGVISLQLADGKERLIPGEAQGIGDRNMWGTEKRRPAEADRLHHELALELLYRLYVLGLPALRSFDYVELNGLTFLQAAESAGLDGRVVNEYVFAVLTADEAVALRVIKPLYCSLFHCDARSFEIDVAAIRPDCEAAGVLQGRNCCVQRRSIEQFHHISRIVKPQAF
jgi:hypothetical protein